MPPAAVSAHCSWHFTASAPRRQWRHCGVSEAAREEILRIERGQSLGRIAVEHGFSNPSRFAQLFRRTYGAYPSEALNTKRRPHIGALEISAQVSQAH